MADDNSDIDSVNSDDNFSVNSDATSYDLEKPSIFYRLREGTVYAGKGLLWSAKSIAKLGIKPLTFLGVNSANLLHSAALSTGFYRMIDPPISLSPIRRQEKLDKYCKSYDLDGFAQYAKESAEKFKEIKPVATTEGTDHNRKLDLYKLGNIGTSIKNKVANSQALATNVTTISDAIGDLNTENFFAEGADSIQSKFLALNNEIANNSESYNNPSQIVGAFEGLKKLTLESFNKAKTETIKKIKETLIPSNLNNLTAPQASFMELCDINDANKIQSKVDEIIKHLESEYDKSEKIINEYFDGIPAEKDTPEVPGLNAKLILEREKSEADLLLRINHLERMIKRGFDIHDLDEVDSTLTTKIQNSQEDDKDFRESCLRKVTLKQLSEEKKWAGLYWGTKQVNSIHTRNGLELICEDVNGKKVVKKLVLPAQYFMSDAAWESKVQLALEDYIDALKIDEKPGEKLSLTINHEVDKNRHMAIMATYRAAIVKGYKPEDIEFTVTGSKEEKGNFKKKPALEVLSSCGLGANDPGIQKDLNHYKAQKEILKRKDLETQKNMQNKINLLKHDPDKDIESSLNQKSKTSIRNI